MIPEAGESVQITLGGKQPRRDVFLDGRVVVESPRGVRGASRLLLEQLDQEFGGSVLVAGSAPALLAMAIAGLHPNCDVHFYTPEAFELRRTHRSLRANRIAGIRVHFGADLPTPPSEGARLDGPSGNGFDWIVLRLSRGFDRALASETLRRACAALKPGGKLLAADDHKKDRWLPTTIEKHLGALTLLGKDSHGRVYVARRKPGTEIRERDAGREFDAMVRGRKLFLQTRPGVFAHGRLDAGALALSEVAEWGESARVVDLGCGSGALGIAAALTADRGLAVLVDSSWRAVETARRNIVKNGASRNALALVADDLSSLAAASFDVVLTNPPYFSDYRISKHFVSEGHRVLASGGHLYLVTKSAERHREIIDAHFGKGAAEETRRRGYSVFRAVKRG